MATGYSDSTRRLKEFELFGVQISAKTVWRFVALRDDHGETGYGEFSHDDAAPDIEDRIANFINPLLNRPIRRAILDDQRGPCLAGGFTTATVFSAVEQALADLEARSSGLPLWRHLGGEADGGPVALYANINRKTTNRSPDGFAQSAREAVARGFTKIKIAPFDGVTPRREDAKIKAGLDRIAATRAAIGDNTLMVDCHWRFSRNGVEALMSELAASNVTWLECPIAESLTQVDDIVAIRKQANKWGIKLAGLETFAGWNSFQPFLIAGAYDVVMPDLKHCGGHAAFREIAERAAELDVAVSAHNPTGPVAFLASLHATAAIGAREPLEIQFDESPQFFELTNPSPQFAEGKSILPSGSGLGVDLARESLGDRAQTAG